MDYSIENYTLGTLVGEGALGQVYRATLTAASENAGPPIAIKIIDPSRFYEGTDDGERFLREAEALSRLKHRAIVGFHHSGFTIGQQRRPYIAMEFVQGQRLKDVAPSLSPEERVDAIMEVLSALEHAHVNSVLHRDVKPPNILIRDSDRQAILVDFGQAYVWEGMTNQTVTRFGAGSFGYIPPEVLSNPRERTVKHDIFSVGVSLYEIIMNRIPTFGSYTPIAEIFPDLSGLDPIVKRALAASAERFDSAKEFQTELSNWKARRQVMSTLTISPRIQALKDRLHAENKKREEAEQQRRTREESIAIQELNHHNVILAMAERAIREVSSVAQDAGRKVAMVKQDARPLPPINSKQPFEYIALHFEVAAQYVCFAATRQITTPFHTNNGGGMVLDFVLKPSPTINRPGIVRPGMRPLFDIPDVQFQAPLWVIYRKGAGVSAPIELGRMICAINRNEVGSSNPQLRLYRNRMTGLDLKSIPPGEIQSPEEIYEYLVSIFGSSL